jgi:uncharacterized protein (DUF736 family)
LTPAFLFVPGRRWPLEQICRLNTENPTHPDFRVVTQGVEIGAGWIRRGENSGKDYVSLSLAAPEFGPRKLYANLGRAAGQDDDSVFTVIWNPADEVSPALALPARGSFSRRILCRRSGLV